MGDALRYPFVPETIRLLRTAADTDGALLEFEDSIPARAGHGGPPMHWHPFQEESFEVAEGRMLVHVDGVDRVLGAGEAISVPPRARHTWRNAGPGPLRQITRFRPALDMEAFFRITSGLASDGKTDARGFPDLLHVAVLASRFRREMVLASPPRPVQFLIFGALAPVGRLSGRARQQRRYLEDPP